MAVDPENNFQCGDLEYSILRKILNRLTFVTGGGVSQAYVDAQIAIVNGNLALKEDKANKSTDGTLSANSDTLYPSQKAAKTYIDNGLAGKQNTLGFTPENVANKAVNLTAPDNVKYPTTLAVSTALAGKQDSLGFTPEDVANKATDFSTLNDTLYPTTQAVADYITAFGGDYVLKAGDTMTGQLEIQLANPNSGFADVSAAHLVLDNTVEGTATLMFTKDATATILGGIAGNEGGIFQFIGQDIYFYTDQVNGGGTIQLAFYCQYDGTLANSYFYGGYASFSYWARWDLVVAHADVSVGALPAIYGGIEDDGPSVLFASSKAGRVVQITPDVRIYGVGNETTSYERLSIQFDTDYQIFMESDSSATIRDIVFGIGVPGSMYEHLRLSGDNDSASAAIGFFAATPVVPQTSGADLTNSVTAGGTDDTIANFTNLVVYATDAAAIRNDIYQLARKLKQINDGLRAYGLFT